MAVVSESGTKEKRPYLVREEVNQEEEELAVLSCAELEEEAKERRGLVVAVVLAEAGSCCSAAGSSSVLAALHCFVYHPPPPHQLNQLNFASSDVVSQKDETRSPQARSDAPLASLGWTGSSAA